MLSSFHTTDLHIGATHLDFEKNINTYIECSFCVDGDIGN